MAPTGTRPAPTEPIPPGLPEEETVLGRAAGENFTVASRLLLGRQRGHLMAIYGFARLVDEIGDSCPGDRLALLDWADREVERAVAGGAGHGTFARVGEAVAACGLPVACLHDLIEANRRDQLVTRYPTYDDLLDYCRLSANPVGRMVLAAFGALDAGTAALSDRICTGLQLVEHWQDVAEDARAGRVYLPGADMGRFGVRPEELDRAPASARLRALLAFETDRARDLLREGEPLLGRLAGRARWAVAGFVAGGRAAADALASAGYDPVSAPVRPRRLRTARHLAALVARYGGRTGRRHSGRRVAATAGAGR